MKTFKKAAMLLIAAAIVLTSAGCLNVDKSNPVIMTAGNFQLHKFDFGLSYQSNEYYTYLQYGAMDAETYFNKVLEDVTRYAVALNEATKRDIKLDESEEAQVDELLGQRINDIDEEYRKNIDQTVTDEAEIQRLLEEKYVQALGFTREKYIEYCRNSIYNNLLIAKFREIATEDVLLDEAQVHEYIAAAVKSSYGGSFGEFVDKYNAFLEGGTTAPYFVPEDCISVNRLLITSTQKEEEVDSLLSNGISKDAFYQLITEIGEDEKMKQDNYLDWGYIVHESIPANYSEGFAYAALYADTSKRPNVPIDKKPAIRKFVTNDNKTIIKFKNEEGVSYIIKNRSFLKGEMPYQEGDEIWNIAYEEAYIKARNEEFGRQCEEWVEKTKVTYYLDRFKQDYMGAAGLPVD